MAGLLPWAIESQIHLQRNPESKRLRHALDFREGFKGMTASASILTIVARNALLFIRFISQNA
jgi:hypothetical protein